MIELSVKLTPLAMDDLQKNKEQLIQELNALRDRVHFLEAKTSKKIYSEKLNDDQQRFQTFVTALPGRAVIFSPDGIYLNVLKRNHIYDTYQPRNAVGKSIYEVQPKEFADFCMIKIQEVLESKAMQIIEYGFINGIGEFVYHEGHITPWYDSESSETLVLWVSRDITAQKNAEKALLQSEEHLKTFINSLPDRAVILSSEGRYLEIIKLHDDDTGNYQVGDVMGQTLYDVQKKEFADFCMSVIKQTLESNTMQTMEYSLVNMADKFVYYEAHISPLHETDSGETHVLWVSRDITRQKHIEEALRQSEERLLTFINILPDRAVIFNREGRYLDIIKNRQVRDIHQTSNDVVGQSLHDIQTKEFADFCLDIINKVIETQEIHVIEYPFINKIGVLIHYEGRVAPLSLDNEMQEARVMWISRDITKQKEAELAIKQYRDQLELLVEERTAELQQEIAERKQLEEMKVRQERLAAVGQLAAGIAHDFNNVMGIIMFDSSMILRSDNLTERNRQKLNRIQKQVSHAANLITQILDFSRRSEREPQILDLRIILGEIIHFLEHTIPERVQVQFSYSKGDFPVNVDPTQIQQIITNFALNAQDAITGNGELSFHLSHIELACDEEVPVPDMPRGNWVKLLISDTGSGIASENLARIFEPFFTTKEVGKGTGLGLAQVYGIVQQHDGFITVDSQPDEGTSFTIYFPLIQYEVINLPLEDDAIPEKGLGEMILVVEDNEDLRESLTDILDLLNYRVLQASNGEEALLVYEKHQHEIRLIMSDVVMPGMDGVELVRQLRDYSPMPRILMMSGFRQDANITPDIEDSVVGWLQKPVDIKVLADTIQKALEQD